MERTLEIADRCNLEIEFGKYHFPAFTPPKEISLDDYLDELAYSGLDERLEGVDDPDIRKIYIGPLKYELGVIKGMQFPGYFLGRRRLINYAKRERHSRRVRGAARPPAVLVAYALNITDLDPIRHVLLFERFLNPERRSMPDIDVDFCIRGRAQVIQYVKDKYGADRVAQSPRSERSKPRQRSRMSGARWVSRLLKPTPSPSSSRRPNRASTIRCKSRLRWSRGSKN